MVLALPGRFVRPLARFCFPCPVLVPPMMGRMVTAPPLAIFVVPTAYLLLRWPRVPAAQAGAKRNRRKRLDMSCNESRSKPCRRASNAAVSYVCSFTKRSQP